MEIKKSSQKEWEISAQCGKWIVGMITYGKKYSSFSMLERHNCTDEVFVLAKGKATIYVADENIKVSSYEMEQGAVYHVKKGEWHHIVVSRDAVVTVVQNSDTTRENSDYITLA
ncbi:MAG: cupin domain-containing protein [Ruminococcaceae bacterium]|nr:cupin domain-containing protein [Oscillospiraceae bacterium]